MAIQIFALSPSWARLSRLRLPRLPRKKDKLLIVSANPSELTDFRHDLELFFPSDYIAYLSVKEQTFQDKVQQIDTETSAIVDGVSTLISHAKYIALAQPEALVKKAPPPKVIERYKTKLQIGDKINYNEFIQALSLEGFDRKDFVAGAGDIAIRGGILDIFPIDKDNPLRIEFFGNEIDSIREFDPISQRSVGELKETEFIARVFYRRRRRFRLRHSF